VAAKKKAGKPAKKAVKAPAKRKVGRPSKYTPALADKICDLIAQGQSLVKICKAENMPSRIAVLRWVSQDEEFRDKYTHARELQAEFYAEQIIEISDDSARDMRLDGNGEEVVDHDHIARSRLRVDARKWYASKVAPKKWGDKLQHGGADDLPPIRQSVDVNMTPADAYRETLG